MQNSNKNIFLKGLVLIFVLISIAHACFGIYVQRGLYLDGTMNFLNLLNQISTGDFSLFYNDSHPSFVVTAIQQLPVVIAGGLFHIKNKLYLSYLYSFSPFVIPLLLLFWNFVLAKRTEKYGILFWNIFSYSLITLVYQINSSLTTIIGFPACFVLLNYLLGDIKYNKFDKIGIALLLIILFGINEFSIFAGALFFITMLILKKKGEIGKEKIAIGIVSALASIYSLIYTIIHFSFIKVELPQFFTEICDFAENYNKFSLFVSIITVGVLIYMLIRYRNDQKPKLFNNFLIIIYSYILYYMFYYKNSFLDPITEGHFGCTAYIINSAILLGIIIYHMFDFQPKNELIKKCITPVLLCGITLSAWQIVTSYYWDKNIKYFMSELDNCKETIYIPEEHEAISSFENEKLRRFIWHNAYLNMAIIVSKDYKIKTLPINYKNQMETGNDPFYDKIYPILDKGELSVPYDNKIDIKNDYWDLTDFANALEKYQKKN